MSLLVFVIIGVVVGNIILLLYWQLIVAEGTYLGTGVVTVLYDLMARRYDHIKQYNPESEAKFVGRPLLQALNGNSAPYVLDVATGTARVPLALFGQPTFNGRIVGLDSSRRMLRVAAEKTASFKHRIDLVWRDAADLPFPDGTFDAVTCLEMLEFTPDPEAQLAELVRVLRRGGVLLTTRRRGMDARLMPGKTHSPDEFRALLAALGMAQVSVQPWQVDYDIVWAVRGGHKLDGHASPRLLNEVLRCPVCRQVASVPESGIVCQHCGTHYGLVAGVIEMRRAAKGGAFDEGGTT